MDSPMLMVVALTLATILLADLVMKAIKSRRGQVPPGPLGIPFLGWLSFVSDDPHRSLDKLSRAYGPVSSFWVGSKLFVAVSSPSAAMDVLKVHDAVFASHPVTSVTNILSKGGLDLLWAPYGPHWRFARKVVTKELLNSTVINSFRPVRRREVHRMLSRLRSAAEGGHAANIHNTAAALSMNVILGMVWDDSLRDDTGRIASMVRELLEVVAKIVQVAGIPDVSDFLPILAPLDLQGLHRRMRDLRAQLDAVVDAIIEHKKAAPSEEGKPKDFLELLLDLVEKKDPEIPLEIEHLRGILLDMIVAGTDPTSGTIEWAMTELMRNPKTMAKVQKELDVVVGEDGVLEERHLPQLSYLDAAVKETLRLHPVLPLLVPHTPSETTTIGGYPVPRGAWVFVNIWKIQRDPTLWAQPLVFRPERFLGEDSSRYDYSGRSFEFMPFSRGRRICAGLNMGEKMVKYTVGSLLHSLNWRLPPGVDAIDDQDKFMFALKKKDPLVLVPSLRMPQYSMVQV